MNTAADLQPSPASDAAGGHPRPGAHRPRRRSLPTVIISTVLVLATVAGCGIRLESPAPAALVPDADEISRQAAVADVLLVGSEARLTLPSVDPASPVATFLEEIDTTATAHAVALGGEYVSGVAGEGADPAGTTSHDASDGQTALPPGSVTDDEGTIDPSVAASPTDAATASPSAAPAPSVPRLVTVLTQSADRARASLGTPGDPALARLYASVAASHLDQARSLAALAGVDAPAPESFTTTLPAALPKNLSAAELVTVVRSEDAAGYAYEVMAARLADADRTAARERAAEHRERAQGWAELASLDGAATDPREVAYDLGTTADGTPALESRESMVTHAAEIEERLADAYATFVGQVEADARSSMLDLLADAHLASRSWGAPASTFPGMPELAG